MKYKALICDVDGTLVPNRKDGMPSKKVIDAVENAAQMMPVGIATARSYWETVGILNAFSFSSPCIITGGAQIIDPNTRKTFFERAISREDMLRIGEIALGMNILLTVADRNGVYPYKKDMILFNPLDMFTETLTHEKADDFENHIMHISTIAAHKVLAWDTDGMVQVVITHPEASKQDAILKVAKLLRIQTKEIIGVGEGYNDFAFLMACGLKVAMGNAVDEVKAIADYIAPSVDEDGVAEVIERFILSRRTQIT